jgi:hypothetical protein
MPSFAECVSKAVKRKAITKKLADEILAAEDPQDAIDDLLADASRQRRETAIQAVRTSQAISDVFSHPSGPYAGLRAILGQDPTGQLGTENIEQLAEFYLGRYQKRMAEAMSRMRSKKLGFAQDEEVANQFARAVYGEAVEDADIAKFGREWLDLVELIRKDFNRQGGSIPKNENFLLPQKHDLQRVKAAGYENWRNRILPMLDRTKMLNELGRPLTDEQLEEGLKHSFESITTGGLNKLKDANVPRLGRKLSRRHSERRFLYFKDAKSWTDYHNEFGGGDIYTTLTDYMEMMANDVALMRRMGPNTQSTYDAVIAQIKVRDELTQFQEAKANALFDTVTGRINRGEMTSLADGFQTTRNILTAAFLPKAWLSAIADVGFIGVTSNYNNIPMYKVMQRQMRLMGKDQERMRVFAIRAGLMADNWVARSTSASRYSEITGTNLSTKIAEGVMRGSLLTPWTDSGRKAFGMEFSAMLADNVNVRYADLDPNMRRGFETYGITEQDWDNFRKQDLLDFDGAKFADLTQDGGVKFHQMVLTETDYAVPTPTARVRAITSGGLGRGTIPGQAWRSAMMLKSFPFTIAATHFYRVAYMATMGERLQYGGALLATSLVMGGLSLQLKDIAAGRNPRPIMDEDTGIDPKFFAAALVQGGGLGIFGDFLFADANRYGGGLASTAFGPTGQLVNDVDRLIKGNIQEVLAGEDTDFLRESVRFTKRYTPSLWQVDLLKNAMFDQLEIMADPAAEKRFNRIMRSRERDYGQKYWWQPGEMLPESPPQLGKTLEEAPQR